MPELQLTSISQALSMPAKMPVIRIQGKLTKLQKARQHDGQYGVVFYQDATLINAEGSIKVSFGRAEPIPDSLNNHEIELRCGQSKKDQSWIGVTTHDDSYQGKTTRVLKVGNPALITVLNGAGGNGWPAQEQPNQSTRPANQKSRPAEPSGDPYVTMKKDVGRAATLMHACAKCAEMIREELGWSTEDARAMANTLYIDLKSATDFNSLPVFKPTAPPPPQSDADPEPDDPGVTQDDGDFVPF